MSFLQVNEITKIEQGRAIVHPISFKQEKLQRIGIAGETGSGKSTLLKMIAGLIQPDGGAVFFNQEKVLGPLEQLLPGHPKIGYLSQHFELRNNYRVEELLAMSNRLSDDDAAIVYAICRIDHLMKRKNDQISGGEKQRIALAKLLITAPSLLFLDEPFSNLDRVHKQIIQSVIDDICTQLKITCILVSHDATDLLYWVDRLLIMKDGKIIQDGNPRQLYFHPANEYVAALLGDYNLVDTILHPAFEQLIGEGARGKKAMIRPEQFSINKEGLGLMGIVKRVLFFGSYYIIEVLLDGLVIKIRTTAFQFYIGDKVFIQLSV
jgi:iron(III) transport system ATP-binding protein